MSTARLKRLDRPESTRSKKPVSRDNASVRRAKRMALSSQRGSTRPVVGASVQHLARTATSPGPSERSATTLFPSPSSTRARAADPDWQMKTSAVPVPRIWSITRPPCSRWAAKVVSARLGTGDGASLAVAPMEKQPATSAPITGPRGVGHLCAGIRRSARNGIPFPWACVWFIRCSSEAARPDTLPLHAVDARGLLEVPVPQVPPSTRIEISNSAVR